MVTILRFVFGAIAGAVLVAFFAFFGLMPFWLGASLPVIVGGLAMVFGDSFLIVFLRIFRWLQ